MSYASSFASTRTRAPVLTIAALGLAALGFTPPGQAQPTEPRYNQINLSASAEREVENDLLVAFVFAEVEANDQTDAADQVNQAVSWAADRARRVDGVEVQTAQYSTRPLYANGRRITGWVARQSLRLESKDAAALSELLGTLQERVAIQSVNYDLSKETREATEEALIAEALGQFNRRANLVARELGHDGFRIVQINIGSSGPFFYPRESEMQRMSVGAAAAPPEIEAGRQTVSVSINGTVELDGTP